jgi:hypothetical protein
MARNDKPAAGRRMSVAGAIDRALRSFVCAAEDLLLARAREGRTRDPDNLELLHSAKAAARRCLAEIDEAITNATAAGEVAAAMRALVASRAEAGRS